MNNVKRIICTLILLSMLLSLLCACSFIKKPGEEGGKEEEKVTEDEGTKIGNPSAIGATSDPEDGLPIMKITTDSGEDIVTKEYQGAAVSSEGSSVEECNFEGLRAEVKCRGNFTFTGTKKKSFRVKFEEKINLYNQGKGAAKSWVLMAEHCDQSFLRNHIAFTMARVLTNIDYVSSSSYIHLYINDEYRGIYNVVEQHQVQKNRVNIEEDPEVIDTDYFIEWDEYANEDGNIEGLNWFRCGGNKFLVKSDFMTEEKCAFLEQYFNETNEAIIGGAQRDIKKYIDIDSFVDMYILHEVTKNMDVGWSSFFLVKNAEGKISCTCPWDFDLSFGNDERLDGGSFENLYAGNSEYAFGWGALEQGNEWFCYLMRQKWFVKLVIARWNEVKNDLEKVALEETDRILLCFGDDIANNFKVWNIFGKKINQEPPQIRELKSYEEHVKYFREWTVSRIEWIDEYFSNNDTKYLTTEYEEEDWWRPW